jgi:hypothetical protein
VDVGFLSVARVGNGGSKGSRFLFQYGDRGDGASVDLNENRWPGWGVRRADRSHISVGVKRTAPTRSQFPLWERGDALRDALANAPRLGRDFSDQLQLQDWHGVSPLRNGASPDLPRLGD